MRRYCAHIAFSISHFLGLYPILGWYWCAYQDAKMSKKGAKMSPAVSRSWSEPGFLADFVNRDLR
jgi:hypothetical protein